jgi:hypothetical protein
MTLAETSDRGVIEMPNYHTAGCDVASHLMYASGATVDEAGTPSMMTEQDLVDYMDIPVETWRVLRAIGAGPRSFLLGRRVEVRPDRLSQFHSDHAPARFGAKSPTGTGPNRVAYSRT